MDSEIDPYAARRFLNYVANAFKAADKREKQKEDIKKNLNRIKNLEKPSGTELQKELDRFESKIMDMIKDDHAGLRGQKTTADIGLKQEIEELRKSLEKFEMQLMEIMREEGIILRDNELGKTSHQKLKSGMTKLHQELKKSKKESEKADILNEKVDELRQKIQELLQHKETETKRHRELDKKIRQKVDEHKKQNKGLELQIKNLEKMYNQARKNGKYDLTSLQKIENRIDFLKRKLKERKVITI